jgi:GNAT superfamily N-acetyltransferase
VIDPDVRPVDPGNGDDLAQLHLLEHEARAALVGERGGDRWLAEHPKVGDGWSNRCRAEGVDILVAHIGDVAVGYIVGLLGADRIICVDQVWVTPLARENGFGDALLAVLIARAKGDGAVAVQGESLPGDRHTKNLYERAGIVARLITTYREF